MRRGDFASRRTRLPDGTLGAPYVLARGEGLRLVRQIDLTPDSDTKRSSASHAVTATVRENREPIVDTTVTFTVLSGLNAGKTGTAGRIESGQATFTYTDTGGPGTDPIQAHCFEDSESKKESNVVTVPWGTAAATPPTRPRASASRTRTRRIRCRLGRA